MDVLFSALPLVVVVFLMAGPWPLPATIALPVTALGTLFIRWLWFGADFVGLSADAFAGVIAALTPILIVGGAVALFQALERGGALATWRAWLDSLNPHPIARLMTVAWAFVYLIEGASGFGTPAALAAPILVACGMPAIRAAVICLIFDTFPVTFGAVGTPVWFGMSELGLAEEDILAVGARAGIINAVVALPIVVVSLRLVVQWQTIFRSLPFIAIAVMGCVIPAAIVAQFGSEFPSLIGGGIGLVIAVIAAKFGIGLGKVDARDETENDDLADGENQQAPEASQVPSAGKVLRAFSPLLLCVALLVVTRMPFFPFKSWLTASPSGGLDLGFLQIGISAGGTLLISDIFGTTAAQKLQLLWVPGVIPFVLVALLTPWLLGVPFKTVPAAFAATWARLKGACIALIAGLILVKFLQNNEVDIPACTTILGQAMASGLGPIWPAVAPWLGALGSFFSGSGTMSNLTFAPVQMEVAQKLDLNLVHILALQTIGGGIGNMVCIHNIVAVNSILGLERSEGTVLRKTVLPMVFYALLAFVGGLIVSGLMD